MASDGRATTLSEAAQALICAILDYYAGGKSGGKNQNIVASGFGFTNKVLPDTKKGQKRPYSLFVENILNYDKSTNKNNFYSKVVGSRLKITGVRYKELESFLNKNSDWFVSSISIANSIFKEIGNKLPSWKGALSSLDFFYHRDTSIGLMKNIEEIFSVVNKESNSYFTSRDRWCPADIYIASEMGYQKIEKIKTYLNDKSMKSGSSNKFSIDVAGKKYFVEKTFDSINVIFRGLTQEKSILPLSLKKSGSMKYEIVPVKLFNSGPPLIGSNKKVLKGHEIPIEFKKKYIIFGGEGNANFYSSIDMFIEAKPPTAEGFTTLRMQIRDKGGSSSNLIQKNQEIDSWKFGMQGVAQFKPATAQAGGVGGGTLFRILGSEFERKFKVESKKIITNICGKIDWKGKKIETHFSSALSSKEKEFIREFKKLHVSMSRNSSVEMRGENSLPTTTKEDETLLFYLDKLSSPTGIIGKAKSLSASAKRYKVAQWFLSKYFCLNLAKVLTDGIKISNEDAKVVIFNSALSVDKYGPSGKSGGGSGVFIKAGS